MKRFARNKRSSLLQKSINYNCKRFIVQAPGSQFGYRPHIKLPITFQVSSFHKQHRGMSREEAILEYLKVAQDLVKFWIPLIRPCQMPLL
jgi:hypothetical protein